MNDQQKNNIINIVKQVIGWGFPAVFCILGIVLMGLHDKLKIHEYYGLAVVLSGLAMYCLVTLFTLHNHQQTNAFESKINELEEEIKKLEEQVFTLSETVAKLSVDLATSKEKNTWYEKEMDRKQRKIDELKEKKELEEKKKNEQVL